MSNPSAAAAPCRVGYVGLGNLGVHLAASLIRAGHQVTVFEQSKAFLRVGADINLTPNAVRALDGLGIGAAVRIPAARPTHRISRMWDSGEETSRLEMSDAAEQKYGAPQLTIHRADLLAALAERAVPSGPVRTIPEALAAAPYALQPHSHPTAGESHTVRSPIAFDGDHLTSPRHPPLLGEHTRDLLLEAGFSESEAQAALDGPCHQR